ncbi:hypothetical protein [Actinomadura fibrosa]|uniref:Uncharacterized protein n=2 Tax=Actinomadura fibrosa TaxID=111802 RepID=A0ABW2XSF5_9ACTN
MLTGSYHPRTDHLRFNQRIPDAFPFIDYEVGSAELVNDRAVLIEEFLHRCQWAATPFGLVFRQAALAQVRESIGILRHAAADPAIRLPTPWFDLAADPDPALPQAVRTGLTRLRAIETLQRFLLGIPLGCPAETIAEAVDISREALTESTPLRFGTFRSWPLSEGVYRANGTPIMHRSTRGIMESRASAYTAELLRACSPGSGPLIDEHIRRNRVGLYRALEELASAADVPVPGLLPRHILDLADVALGVQVADIPGLPPPNDYVESMLPYARYALALKDVHGFAEAFELIADRTPEDVEGLSDQRRLDLIVRSAVQQRGQASHLLNLPVMSRRGIMEQNIRAVWAWAERLRPGIDSEGNVRVIEEMTVDAMVYTGVRFFRIYAETDTDTVLFRPAVDTFVFLARFCDWPVVEYPNGELEVFLCDPMDDPQPVVRQSITMYEVTRLLRRLLVEACGDLRSREWRLTLWQEPLIDVFGVRSEQFART